MFILQRIMGNYVTLGFCSLDMKVSSLSMMSSTENKEQGEFKFTLVFSIQLNFLYICT